jgi:hypothetical protein
MAQSRILCIGMEVHKETIAVASVAPAHGAEAPSLGTIGTRQCDIDHLLRQMHSKAQPLRFVSAAGPCGSWLYRSLRKKDDACWVVAPSLRLQRLEQALHEHGQAWRLSPVGEALQALRGVQCPVAVPLVAAMGDLTRCDPPSALRTFWGLVPSAYSSGAQRRQGTMPTAGNTPARRVLVEGAWASRAPAQVR